MRDSHRSCSLIALTTAAVLLGAAQPLRAEDPTIHYAYPTEERGFFHKVGDFFRDLFATELPVGPRPTPPQPTAARYNLDLPAPGTGYGYGKLTPHSTPDVTEQNTVDMYPKNPSKSKGNQRPAEAPSFSNGTSVKKTADSTPAPKTTKHTTSTTVAKSDTSAPTKKVASNTTTTSKTSSSSTASSSSESEKVPAGTRTGKSTRVKSPFPPYNELDVTGLPSGSLAQDPTTQKVFRVP